MHFTAFAAVFLAAACASAAAVPAKRTEPSNLMIFADNSYLESHKSEVISTLSDKFAINTLSTGLFRRAEPEVTTAASEDELAALGNELSAAGHEDKWTGYLDVDALLNILRAVGPAGEDIAHILEYKLRTLAKKLRRNGIGWIKDPTNKTIALSILEWYDNHREPEY